MNHYANLAEDGRVVQAYCAEFEGVPLDASHVELTREQFAAVLGAAAQPGSAPYLVDGEVLIVTPPAPGFHFDKASRSWRDGLSGAAKAARDTQLVQEARQRSYPAIGDQLDALWKELSAGPIRTPEAQAMAARIAAVKSAHPKP